MGRWQPGADDRLRAAALDLFEEHGFEQTTVAELAERAGVTERTFYRYFRDKRDVLFSGADRLREVLVAAVDSSAPLEGRPPAGEGVAPPEGFVHDVQAVILAALGDYFVDALKPDARRRQAVLDTEPALRERDLLKQEDLRRALASALQRRGVSGSDAELVAAATLSAFRVAFAQWLHGATDMPTALRRATTRLGALLNDSASTVR